jgi:FkbM family methyltransferase
MYEINVETWQTPGGHTATMQWRSGSSDWNTISACLVNGLTHVDANEYHLPAGLSGWGLDLGAHIGAVTVGLLLDNPDMRVVAIEAVPDNAEMIRANLALNGLTERCVLLNAAAWVGKGQKRVEFGYTGSEVATVHAFIGTVTPWDDPAERQYAIIPIVTLREALAYTDGQGFVWAKSDCEGCEHKFLKGALLGEIGTIEGEWHQRDGTAQDFVDQLGATHTVTWGQGIGGGPFTAVRR